MLRDPITLGGISTVQLLVLTGCEVREVGPHGPPDIFLSSRCCCTQIEIMDSPKDEARARSPVPQHEVDQVSGDGA